MLRLLNVYSLLLDILPFVSTNLVPLPALAIVDFPVGFNMVMICPLNFPFPMPQYFSISSNLHSIITSVLGNTSSIYVPSDSIIVVTLAYDWLLHHLLDQLPFVLKYAICEGPSPTIYSSS